MRHTLLFIVLFQVVNYTFAQVKRYHPLRINNNITLDGKLSEQEWQQAEMESDFMQYDPSGGAEPSERTEIKILYNDTYLFVGLHAYDHLPEKLVNYTYGYAF